MEAAIAQPTSPLTRFPRDGSPNWVFSTVDRAKEGVPTGKTAWSGQGPLRPPLALCPWGVLAARGSQVQGRASAAGADGAWRRPPGAGAPNLLPLQRESPPISVLVRKKDPPPQPTPTVHTSPVDFRRLQLKYPSQLRKAKGPEPGASGEPHTGRGPPTDKPRMWVGLL